MRKIGCSSIHHRVLTLEAYILFSNLLLGILDQNWYNAKKSWMLYCIELYNQILALFHILRLKYIFAVSVHSLRYTWSKSEFCFSLYELRKWFILIRYSSLYSASCYRQGMVSVQREITPDSRVGLSSCFSGVDLSQSQETLVGQSSGRQEPAYESIFGLYEIRHPRHAQPCQCTDTPTAHVLCITVSEAYLKRKVKRVASNIVC